VSGQKGNTTRFEKLRKAGSPLPKSTEAPKNATCWGVNKGLASYVRGGQIGSIPGGIPIIKVESQIVRPGASKTRTEKSRG